MAMYFEHDKHVLNISMFELSLSVFSSSCFYAHVQFLHKETRVEMLESGK